MADSRVMRDLLRGHEKRVYGDQAYKSQGDVIQAKAQGTKDFANQKCKWKNFVDQGIKAKNRWKSKIPYTNRLYTTAALTNIFLVRYSVLEAVRPQ